MASLAILGLRRLPRFHSPKKIRDSFCSQEKGNVDLISRILHFPGGFHVSWHVLAYLGIAQKVFDPFKSAPLTSYKGFIMNQDGWSQKLMWSAQTRKNIKHPQEMGFDKWRFPFCHQGRPNHPSHETILVLKHWKWNPCLWDPPVYFSWQKSNRLDRPQNRENWMFQNRRMVRCIEQTPTKRTSQWPDHRPQW